MQEKIFDNPRFSFVADTLKHVSDRFTQLIITKEATSYVVSERILKKTPEQKALIRKHLEKFCGLYTGMSSNWRSSWTCSPRFILPTLMYLIKFI